jgi:hypothetical protein
MNRPLLPALVDGKAVTRVAELYDSMNPGGELLHLPRREVTRGVLRETLRLRRMPLRHTLAAASAIAIVALAERAPRAEDVVDAPQARPVRAALELAPLDLFIGRLAFVGTMLVAPHHAITATLHGDYMPREPFVFKQTNDVAFGGLGGELGWHVYARGEELRGFWFGPSLVLEALSAQVGNDPSRSFTATGLAFDAGVTATGPIVVDFALGLQMTHLTNDESPPDIVALIAGGGPRPRVLLGIGLPL